MRTRSERLRLVVILGVTLAVAQGCATSSSENIGTVEIHPEYTLTGNSASSVECAATFRVGGSLGTYLELTSGDNVTCSDGTNTVTMTKESDFFGGVSYKATGLTYGANRTYTFTFNRPNKTGETFASTVTLPAAVTIATPASDASVSKNGFNLVWSGNGPGSVEVLVTHPNGSVTVNNKSDAGTANLDYQDLNSVTTGSGKVKITRSHSGVQATGLNGRGSIHGKQYGEQSVVITN